MDASQMFGFGVLIYVERCFSPGCLSELFSQTAHLRHLVTMLVAAPKRGCCSKTKAGVHLVPHTWGLNTIPLVVCQCCFSSFPLITTTTTNNSWPPFSAAFLAHFPCLLWCIEDAPHKEKGGKPINNATSDGVLHEPPLGCNFGNCTIQ